MNHLRWRVLLVCGPFVFPQCILVWLALTHMAATDRQVTDNPPAMIAVRIAALVAVFRYVELVLGYVYRRLQQQKLYEEQAIRLTLGRSILEMYPLIGGFIGMMVTLASGNTLVFTIMGIIGAHVFGMSVSKSLHSPDSVVVRGRSLSAYEDARVRAEEACRTAAITLVWAGIELPDTAAEANFCVVGAPGSGKTLTLETFMHPLLPRIVPGSNTRALIYDAKCDLLSYLSRLQIPRERVHVLNPFDRRSVAWNMAADIDCPAVAQQVAATLIPTEEGPNRFFSDAARALLAGVFNALILNAPEVWTFRDVIVTMQNVERLRRVLSRHAVTQPLIDEYFEPRETFRNIRSTISSYMAGYQTVASLWHRSHREPPLSLKEWVRGDSILVLGNDDSLRAPLDAVNRVIFQRATELLLSRTDDNPGRTWVILDELKEAGRLDALPRLLTKGRSFGIRAAIGFQDISGLQSTYGEKLASEIVAMCANISILRLNSHPTAEWAAHLIGEAELQEETVSTTTTDGQYSTSTTTSEHIIKREAVLASELMTLPLPDGDAFWGYHIVPSVGTYKAPIAYREYLDSRPAATDQNYEPRDVAEQYLQPWTAQDETRLANLLTAQPQAPPAHVAACGAAMGEESPLQNIKRVTRPRSC